MKKSIQLDAMRRDDAKRNLKIDAGISKRIEKLNDYLFDIFNITLEKNELKNFCKINNDDNLESLKEKLYNEYRNSHQIKTKKNDVRNLKDNESYNFEAKNSNEKKKINSSENKENPIYNFVYKWFLICYSMTEGNKEIDKYLKFLELVAKKQLMYKTYVTFDWKIRKFFPVPQMKLTSIEERELVAFLNNKEKEEVIKLLQNFFNKN